MREKMNGNRGGLELDLQKLLLAYLKRWWFILVCGVLGGLIALVVTMNFITPLYRARVTIYVNNISAGQQVEYISNTNLATAQRLVSTYVNIIESDTVLSRVVEYGNLPYTPEEIRTMMSAEQKDDTEIFTVFISNPDPAMAVTVANAIADVAPSRIGEIVEGSSTKIIDYATEPRAPYAPSERNNTILGVFAGVALAIIYLTVKFLLDVRIKVAEDLESIFAYPVLGQIPVFAPPDTRKMSSYAYGDNTAAGAKGGKKI